MTTSATKPPRRDRQNLQIELAVVDQKRMARFRSRVNLGVQEANAFCVSWGVICVEDHALPALKLDLPFGKRADPKLGTLEIRQDSDGAVFRFKLAEKASNIVPKVVVARMAHIDAEHVRASLHEAFHHSRACNSRVRAWR